MPTGLPDAFPDMGPVPGAIEVSDGSPRPRDHEANLRGSFGQPRRGSGQCPALSARASQCAARARRRWLVYRSITIELTDQRQVTAVLMATPGALAGAIAGITHNDEAMVLKPAYPHSQQQPGEVCWHLIGRAVDNPAQKLRMLVRLHG
jgi:hypothetical protein